MKKLISEKVLEYDHKVVFHFNKMHLTDETIPMWVLKSKGNTYYINHLDSKVGFSTKETPDNPHTKGSLKFRGTVTIRTYEDETIATME